MTSLLDFSFRRPPPWQQQWGEIFRGLLLDRQDPEAVGWSSMSTFLTRANTVFNFLCLRVGEWAQEPHTPSPMCRPWAFCDPGSRRVQCASCKLLCRGVGKGVNPHGWTTGWLMQELDRVTSPSLPGATTRGKKQPSLWLSYLTLSSVSIVFTVAQGRQQNSAYMAICLSRRAVLWLKWHYGLTVWPLSLAVLHQAALTTADPSSRHDSPLLFQTPILTPSHISFGLSDTDTHTSLFSRKLFLICWL